MRTMGRLVTDATQLERPSLFTAFSIMAGCTDPWALTTLSVVGVTKVSRSVVQRAHMVAAGL